MAINNSDNEYLEKLNLMEAVTVSQAGMAFLQWLVRLTGFNKPSMSMEDASRRDIWLSIRSFIPIERLAEIEHFDIKIQQQRTREMFEQMPQEDTEEYLNA